jgi:hypothetical protein
MSAGDHASGGWIKPEIPFQWPRSPSHGGLESEMAGREARCDDHIHLRGARRPGAIQLCCRALRATKRASDTRLHGKRILPLRGVQANARAGWQLQHGRVLTFA